MLSVVIPAYNEEKYIEQTLQAISGCETIVVCNGCTDRTAEKARKYATTVIELKEKGVSKARNMGVQYATYNRLVFLDADIRVDPHVLQEIRNAPYTIGTSKVKALSDHWFDHVIMFVKSSVHSFGTCTGLLFCDKEIFIRIGGFEEDRNIKEDGRFLRNAMRIGKFGIVDGYVYNNMRRYRKQGYLRIAWFWIKAYLINDRKEYTAVR